MLPGIKIFNLKKSVDERGFFCELLRNDWQELLDNDTIIQTNLSMSHPQIVRAWHKHSRGQVDYLMIVRGITKICAFDDRKNSATSGYLDEIIADAEKPQLIKIPGFYWHGTMAISDDPSFTLYFVTKLYDYTNPDEERRPWNDPTIIPTTINGKKEDPRTCKPWKWI